MGAYDCDCIENYLYERRERKKAQLSQEGTTKGTTFSCSHENDTISRQAAIDALDFEIVHMTAYCDGKNEGNPLAQYNKGLEDGKKAIEALPSAQPEEAIQVSWIEGEIAELKESGEMYSYILAELIGAMVRKWKERLNATKKN